MPEQINNLRLKYAVEMRLRFIDFLMHHYGTLNRSAIMDFFGVSMPQAALDIRTYVEIAPGNMIYDKSAKTYRRSEHFTRVWA